MNDQEIRDSLSKLHRASRTSLGMILLGVFFLVGSIYYSATRLRPLEDEIKTLEAKRDELRLNIDRLVAVARPMKNARDSVTAWIYMGRASDAGKWAPLADGVEPVPNLGVTKDFHAIKILKNKSFVENLESKVNLLDKTAINEPVVLVRSGTTLQISEIKTEPSIGGAELVWAKVTIPPEALLEIAAK